MKNVIVALEASKHDKSILSYLQKIHSIYSFEKIVFVHVIPDYLQSKVEAPDVNLEDLISNKLREEITTHFSPDKLVNDEIVVLNGSPYRKIIEFVEQTEPDLLVLGKKKSGSGITPRRIAHNAKCNILFVADIHPETIKTIVVPTDYSKDSVKALEEALFIGNSVGNVNVQSTHVVRMLPSDYYYGLDASQHYFEVLKESAKNAYTTMLEEAQLPESQIDAVYLEDHRGNVARSLQEHIEHNSPDLVVLGATGHSKINNFLFGSTAERLVSFCRSSCILLVRHMQSS